MTTTYGRLIEYNDWEGETWNFWLAVDGNGPALDRLVEFVAKRYGDDDPQPFRFTDDLLSAEQVDLLVRFAECDYMPTHNRVDGVLTLPGELGDDFARKLYKGGIKGFFTEAGA
ncbi:hypothetical protein [Nocardia otitidiscaviarum]|uniref:hypothetical protein n=1 Tax=Nocardia otitidiscaviarum TaxID=1823 RepID=UPI0004A6E83A|nr:hypothetical protein [Nocardia otitidiscaviarum]